MQKKSITLASSAENLHNFINENLNDEKIRQQRKKLSLRYNLKIQNQ